MLPSWYLPLSAFVMIVLALGLLGAMVLDRRREDAYVGRHRYE